MRLDDARQLVAGVRAGHDVARLRTEVRERGRRALVEAAHELVVQARVALPAAAGAGDRLADLDRAAHGGRTRVARRADRIRLLEVALDRARRHARVDARRRAVAREVPVAHDPGQRRERGVEAVVDLDGKRPTAVAEARIRSGLAGAHHDRRVGAVCRPAGLTRVVGRERHRCPPQLGGIEAAAHPAPTADHRVGGRRRRRRMPLVIGVDEVDRLGARAVQRRRARERHDGRVVRERERVVVGVDRDSGDVQPHAAAVEVWRAGEDVEIRGGDRLPRGRDVIVEHAMRRGDDVPGLTDLAADRAPAELSGHGVRPVVADQGDLVVELAGVGLLDSGPLAPDHGPRWRAAHSGHDKRGRRWENPSLTHHG